MSALTYEEASLLNSLSEQVRELEARVDNLVETMTKFKDDATLLLVQMAEANKPQGEQ